MKITYAPAGYDPTRTEFPLEGPSLRGCLTLLVAIIAGLGIMWTMFSAAFHSAAANQPTPLVHPTNTNVQPSWTPEYKKPSSKPTIVPTIEVNTVQPTIQSTKSVVTTSIPITETPTVTYSPTATSTNTAKPKPTRKPRPAPATSTAAGPTFGIGIGYGDPGVMYTMIPNGPISATMVGSH